MHSEDMGLLGFKCGVEIHQQLLTKTKLFCRCPAGCYTTHHDAKILRHMRPTLSEMGVYDGCALMEFKTKKEILYLLNKESVCTYEMDDTPPFPINQEALDIAIEIALLLNCQIVDEVHIARKQYLDGSIPTGFQRTAIVGINGYIDLPNKRIRIRQFSIEEDACREISDDGHIIKFRTDRLGMPLIEVVTEPDFKTPQEAALGVKAIGRLLRATKKLRRGIGAVRQDVNVSIDGGRRVEIKGVPRYQLIAALAHIEALRQKSLLALSEEFKRRRITTDNLKTEILDITAEFNHTRCSTLKDALQNGHKIRGIKIDGISGLLNWKTQPGRTFAHELSGRVRVIACLDNIPNLFHTDNSPDYEGSHIDLHRLRNIFKHTENDVIVIAWGPEKDTITAINEIRERVVEAMNGVPHETRQHLRDGLTDFERILPGADRMYPDTDHPPLRLNPARVEKIKLGLPEKTGEVEARFKAFGLPLDTIEYLALSPHKTLVDELASNGANMKIAGSLLGRTAKSFSRKGFYLRNIKPSTWKKLIDELTRLEVQQKFYEEILIRLSKNPGQKMETLLHGFVSAPALLEPPVNQAGASKNRTYS